MIFQGIETLLIGLGVVGFILLMIFLYVYFKTIVVVPFNEIHVVSRGKKISEYDGKGRYRFYSFFHSRTIIPKHVLDIEPGLMDLHDQDNLPFGVEISIKVQVTDPQKAAATLTRIDHNTVSKVVEDTVMSAARSVAMERTIIEIMRDREAVEKAVYNMVAESLAKLGLSAIIFDIKNILDIEDQDVIGSLERVKIAELKRNARISEAIQDNEAREVEVERNKATEVKIQTMKLEEEQARLTKEKQMAIEQMMVETELLKIEEQKMTRLASIEKEKTTILAQANRDKQMLEAQGAADAVRLAAQAESESVKMRAEAEAESIRMKGLAEAEILKKKSEALKQGSYAGQIKVLEILSQAQVDTAGKIAEALGANNKIIYLPMDGKSNLLSSLIPKLDGVLQSGMLDELVRQLKSKPLPTVKDLKLESPKSSDSYK